MQSTIPRVVALLDEAKECLEVIGMGGMTSYTFRATRALSKITQAQNLLVGDDGSARPEDN